MTWMPGPAELLRALVRLPSTRLESWSAHVMCMSFSSSTSF